jgi:hypothetical protein
VHGANGLCAGGLGVGPALVGTALRSAVLRAEVPTAKALVVGGVRVSPHFKWTAFGTFGHCGMSLACSKLLSAIATVGFVSGALKGGLTPRGELLSGGACGVVLRWLRPTRGGGLAATTVDFELSS